MPTKKYKQKLLKYHICSVARIVACVSFLVLTVIGVSSLVRAMSLATVDNQSGIPASWKVASLGNPETITVPITYWDQRQDDCNDPNRQFEWSECRLYAKGIVQGIVRNQLGSDGLPVPTYNNTAEAWASYHDAFTANVTGNNPVGTSDNFYRWFHETTDANGKQLSKRYDRSVVFRRTGNNTYEYGSKGTFPLDDVDFSNDDSATKTGHNFHFTAHMQIPMKIAADGSETFWFSGDDDVWVFLNGQLVLDLGGLHSDTEGQFTIDTQGNVTSTVQDVAEQSCRQNLPNPNNIGYDIYNNRINQCKRDAKTTTIPTHFKAGDIVNLDFFYAERSTSESNTRITISNMEWPISADSNVDGKIEGKIENSNSNLVQYISSITNRDPKFELRLDRIASYVHDQATVEHEDGTSEVVTNSGFLPLDSKTLYYTYDKDDADSWQPVDVTAPSNSLDGFTLTTPLTLARSGQDHDTIYFRYFAETSEYDGTITNRTSYYTDQNGASGVTYDHTVLNYLGKAPEPVNPDYNVNVTYRIDFGDETPDPTIETPTPVHETKKSGDTYTIPSPSIDGFTPSIKIVTGTVEKSDVNVEVVYTKTPVIEPQKYPVVIHYLKTDGSPAFPDYNANHENGEYDFTPEDLDGYTKDRDNVHIIVDGAPVEEFVYYTPIKIEQPDTPATPITPVDPTEPNTPDVPSEDVPTIPVVPGDDDLVYVGPLGEVAYVPNTGIVSEVLAPLFTQYFAETILSQWFVMTVLFIFAASFAVYFSMRKYLNLKNKEAMHAATTSSVAAKSSKTAKKTSKTKSLKSTSVKSAKTSSQKSSKSSTKPSSSKRKTSK